MSSVTHSAQARVALHKRNTFAGRVAKRLREAASCWQLYVLLLPAVAAVALFHYAPFYGIQIVFKNFRSSLGIAGSEWVGLKNFIRFLTYPDFWKVVTNTLSISLYSLATFPIAVILALLLNEVRVTWFKKTVQMITYAPHFISTVVIVAMLNLFMARSNGLFNNIIAQLGGERIDFLGTASMFNDIYVWSGVWQGMGWNSIIYLAALSNIDVGLYEAAKIDGAGRFKQLWHVTLPGIAPTIVILLVISIGQMMSVSFEKVLLLMNGGNQKVAEVISTYTYKMGLVNNNYSYSAAVGLFEGVLGTFLVIGANYISRRVSETSLW